jgi:hypothetical protein
VTGAVDIRTGLRAVFAIAALSAAFVLPAQAFAQDNNCSNAQSDPTAAQYCPQSAILGSNSGASNTPSSTGTPSVATPSATHAVAVSSAGGSLPFTGLDVGTLVLAAAILTGTGLVLRRLTASGAHRD